MKQFHVKGVIRDVDIDTLIIGPSMKLIPEHIIDLILYFIYCYQFKNRY